MLAAPLRPNTSFGPVPSVIGSTEGLKLYIYRCFRVSFILQVSRIFTNAFNVEKFDGKSENDSII